MNRAFSLLLMFVLVHTQAWAISGEPVFQVNNLSYSGSYAGVVIPVAGETAQYSTGTAPDGSSTGTGGGTGLPGSDTLPTESGTAVNDGIMSLTEDEKAQLGLFSFSQPAGTGFAQGVLAMFVGGTVFTGAIEGVLNPKNGKLTGLITASAQVTLDSDTYTSGFGTIKARIKNYSESGVAAPTATLTSTSTGARVAARVVGSLTLRLYDPSDTGIGAQRNFGLRYELEGWQQSFGTAAATLPDIF